MILHICAARRRTEISEDHARLRHQVCRQIRFTADFQASPKKTTEEADLFFSQWLDSTGAPPSLKQVHRLPLGNNKDFRVVGQIDQDLDLFRMPVELKSTPTERPAKAHPRSWH